MGCGSSKGASSRTQSGKRIKRPVWSSAKISTVAELKVRDMLLGFLPPAASQHAKVHSALVLHQAKREEFWDTQPHYGGDKGAPRFARTTMFAAALRHG